MYGITVCYGRPTDLPSFDNYYALVHTPLASKISSIAAFTAAQCQALGGSQEVDVSVAGDDEQLLRLGGLARHPC